MTTGYVYLLRTDAGWYKIGNSKKPEERAANFAGLPFVVELDHKIETEMPNRIERLLHKRFEERHVRGEWFLLTPEDVLLIKSVAKCNALHELPFDLLPERYRVLMLRKKRRARRRDSAAKMISLWLSAETRGLMERTVVALSKTDPRPWSRTAIVEEAIREWCGKNLKKKVGSS